MTATPVPRKRWSVRRIVPSPPITSARSTSRESSSWTSSTPDSRATRSRTSSGASTPGRTVTETRLADRTLEPVLEVGRDDGAWSVDEVEEELTVSLGSRQARVYGPGGERLPGQGRLRHLP